MIKHYLVQREHWAYGKKFTPPFKEREFQQTTTTKATRINEHNNGSARALKISVHFFAFLRKTTT